MQFKNTPIFKCVVIAGMSLVLLGCNPKSSNQDTNVSSTEQSDPNKIDNEKIRAFAEQEISATLIKSSWCSDLKNVQSTISDVGSISKGEAVNGRTLPATLVKVSFICLRADQGTKTNSAMYFFAGTDNEFNRLRCVSYGGLLNADSTEIDKSTLTMMKTCLYVSKNKFQVSSDNSFHYVIEPQYLAAGDFSEGVAAIKVTGEKWGYIDKQGKNVIAPQFDDADEFSEGLAAVYFGQPKDGTWGYVNKQGKVKIPAVFNWAGKFSEGLALVCRSEKVTDSKGCEYINKEGQTVFRSQFQNSGRFSEGLTMVEDFDATREKWGYIDINGKLVIKAQFDFAQDFSDGLAQVRIGNDTTGKWGYIDKQGQLVIKPIYSNTSKFSNGMAAVCSEVNTVAKCGYIDKDNKKVIGAKFSSADQFSENLAVVILIDDSTEKRGYIDKEGNMVIKPQFEFAKSFSEGMAVVSVNGKYGYISR